jgi:two-component system response regulator YesN
MLRGAEDYLAARDTFIDFMSLGKVIREKYHFQEHAALSDSKFDYDIFFDLPFISDVEMYVYEIFLSLLAVRQGGEVSYSYIVSKSIAFIEQNYAKSITLSDTAANVEVSHSYLSFIFKQETGTNFNTYLSNYRIEQAKKLFRETNLRIYQVAESVGFSNHYYFSKVFREFTGMSCKEYRNMQLQ